MRSVDIDVALMLLLSPVDQPVGMLCKDLHHASLSKLCIAASFHPVGSVYLQLQLRLEWSGAAVAHL